MPRAKNEPVPTIMAGLPMLPSDLMPDIPTVAPTIDDALQVADDQTTLMSDSVAETRSGAHAKPETAPPTVLDRLREKAEAEKLAIETQWNTLVQKVATDSASEKEVADALRSTGRSLAELEAATDRQRKRNRLLALIGSIPAALATEQAARTAFKALQRSQQEQLVAMKAAYKISHGALTSATWKRTQAENARFDLDSMSREWGAFTPPPPQWTDQYNPEPCIAEQLKVEERVNAQIAARLGPNAATGPYCSAGTEPAKGFRVFANQ
ncbi:MAG: hypothetical protein ACKV2Q_11140 [Planctomycetaceae bacterium]